MVPHGIRFGILTVSDRCSLGTQMDGSGPALREAVKSNGWTVIKEDIVPDEMNVIEDHLRGWCKVDRNIDVVLTTGGTGFAPRDVTPEATSKVIDRPAPAIVAAMTATSLSVTPLAMLSRSVAGIKNKTLIINLPGSIKGARECFYAVSGCLEHAVDLIRDRKEKVTLTHSMHSQLPRSKVLTNNLASRARTSAWPMMEMDKATQIVMQQADLEKDMHIPLKEALGRIISQDIHSIEPSPAFRASVKDGYAVLSKDGRSNRKVSGAYNAGSEPDSLFLESGCCIRVSTGSPIPAAADAVIQVEDTDVISSEGGEEKVISIKIDPKPGLDIREIGSDIKQGEQILSKGTVISSAVLGILAGAGIGLVPVYRLPKIGVISTGNELISPEEAPRPGFIRDSNKITLLSLLKENGFEAIDMGIARDEPSELLACLLKSIALCDVIITTGGVSMGDKDYLKRVLETDLQATIHFGRLNMKPGKPTTFATWYTCDGIKKLLFGLPGNPVSATVTTHLLVLPMLRAMAGISSYFPTVVKCVINFDVKLDERPEYRRAILNFNTDGLPLAESTGSQASSRLTSCRDTNCLLVLPSIIQHPEGMIKKGDVVRGFVIGRV